MPAISDHLRHAIVALCMIISVSRSRSSAKTRKKLPMMELV
jgi:hypothetical protein